MYRLSDESLWNDELASFVHLGQPDLTSYLTHVQQSDMHMAPVYFAAYWVSAFDWQRGINATSFIPAVSLKALAKRFLFDYPDIGRAKVLDTVGVTMPGMPEMAAFIPYLLIGGALALSFRQRPENSHDRPHSNRTEFRRSTLMCIMWFVVPVCLLLVVSLLIRPSFIVRYVSYVTPAFFLILAASVIYIRRVSPPLGKAFIILLVMLYAANSIVTQRPLRAVAHILQQEMAPGELTLLYWGHLRVPIMYYADIPGNVLKRMKSLNELSNVVNEHIRGDGGREVQRVAV